MLITCIASSSAGNCYHISDGSSQLLIECGVSLARIRDKGVRLNKLDGCLITHEHQDHAKYASEVAGYTKVYSGAGTLGKIDLKKYAYQERVVKAGNQYAIGTFKVIPFEVQHDAAEPLGYLIYSTVNGKKLLFATDTYYIKNRFKGLNYIMIECNFDGRLLREYVESGALNRQVAKRYWSSHFELGNVIKFLRAQDLRAVEAIYLMHLSDGLSDADRFRREVMGATGCPVYVCEK